MKKHLLLSLLFTFNFSIYTLHAQTDRIEAASGKVIGMTSGGGVKGGGVVFRFNTGNNSDTICTNTIANGGATLFGTPKGSTLLLAKDKMLYGMSQYGGSFGLGSLYSYNPVTNKDSMLFSFNWINGDVPEGPLMQASNGLLYGMTLYGGDYGQGVMFCFNTVTGTDSVLLSFDGVNGANPYYGKLVQAANGKLYGMAQSGGTMNKGVIFRYNPVTGQDSVVFNFDSAHGRSPYGGLILGRDSMLYGMTTFGGGNDKGVIFRFNPYTNKDTVLYTLNTASGTIPYGSFMQAANGLLYGMTNSGGSAGYGTLFCFSPTTYRDSVLLNFNVNQQESANGDNKVIQAKDGMLYGLTSLGGSPSASSMGTLFRYNPVNGSDSVLASFTNGAFGGVPGLLPNAGLVEDTNDGQLYGVTQQGGAYGFGGTLFRYNPTSKVFSSRLNLGGSGSNNGYITQATLTDGMIYGTTSYGGINSVGTIFKFNPLTNVTTLEHQFGRSDGAAPYGKMLQASDGNLYGTCAHGDSDIFMPAGGHDYGVIFRYNPRTGQDSVVLNFSVNPGGGVEPHGGMIQASDGLLYGMTMRSTNPKVQGVLFSFNPASPHRNTVLVNFNDTNGSSPWGGLMQAKNKLLYGMTMMGGTYGRGVLFSYNTVSHNDSVWVIFNDTNGAYPFGGLLQSSKNSKLYGMTSQGGKFDKGVILRFDPVTHTDTVVFNFDGALHGAQPCGSFIQDTSGLLYGTTRYGGTHNNGVLFTFNVLTNKDSVLLNFNADSGAFPENLIFLNPVPGGVPEVEQHKEVIIVYPNPFANVATIMFGNPGKHYVEVYDINGKLVKQITGAEKQCTITRENMSTGLYLLKVYDSEKRFVASGKIEVQ